MQVEMKKRKTQSEKRKVSEEFHLESLDNLFLPIIIGIQSNIILRPLGSWYFQD